MNPEKKKPKNQNIKHKKYIKVIKKKETKGKMKSLKMIFF